MAFLHCYACGWSQDDFWDTSYNPIKNLQRHETELLDFARLDQPFTDDAGFIREHGNLTLREVIAQNLEEAATQIRGMEFLTLEQAKDMICPLCGEGPLGLD